MLKGLKLQGLCQIIGIITSTMDGITTKTIAIPAGYTSGGSVSLDNTIDNEVSEQADLLSRIKEALQNKAAGGGSIDTALTEFIDLLISRPMDKEIELAIPDNIKYLGNNVISGWYKKNTNYGLKKINLNKVETIGDGVLQNNLNLAEIIAPNLTMLSYDCFFNAQKLVAIHLPNVTQATGGNSFRNCTSLKEVDFDKLDVYSANFTSCPVLAALIIRTPKVCTLKAVINTNNTAFYDGTANIYVPDNLVDSYKTATNWSVHADIIKPISQYGGYQS